MTYWQRISARAGHLHSDGCTGVPDLWVLDCCQEHDVHYRTHRRLNGRRIGKWRSDLRLWWCAGQRSPVLPRWLGWASPVAALYWIGVTVGGWRAWYHRGTTTRPLHREETP